VVSDKEEVGGRGLRGGQFGGAGGGPFSEVLVGGAFFLGGAMVDMGWALWIVGSREWI
jgi:hypothetical protein